MSVGGGSGLKGNEVSMYTRQSIVIIYWSDTLSTEMIKKTKNKGRESAEHLYNATQRKNV